jgi:hypothetical protein
LRPGSFDLWLQVIPHIERRRQGGLVVSGRWQEPGKAVPACRQLAEAFQHIRETGLPTEISNGSGYYRLSFGSKLYQSVNGKEYILPYMSGFGGKGIVFNPNGAISFRFLDGANYELNPLLRVAEVIQPFY